MSQDLIGKKAGIFTIVDEMPYRHADGHRLYKAICNECGFERIAKLRDLSKTERCIHITNASISMPNEWWNSRLGGIYKSMKQRCYNKNNKSYKWYGANGVKICDEWLYDPNSFEEWSLANGYDDTLTIDRVDKTKDYCPENCQWISMSENSRKAGKVNWITVNGETLTGRQWAERLGLTNHTVNDILRHYGMDNTVILLQKMIECPPSGVYRGNKSWFKAYNIELPSSIDTAS